jgi:hypothetical protein
VIAHSVDDPLYYLHNFRQVLLWVESRYADLLDEQELAFLHAFAELAQPAQALMVRMVMRKGELFRCDRLDYAEIGDRAAALQPLLALGWVREPEALSLEQLFALLRKDELALGFAGQLARPRAAKGDLLEQLRALSLAARPLREWFAQAPVAIVQWCLQPLCDRMRLCFFGKPPSGLVGLRAGRPGPAAFRAGPLQPPLTCPAAAQRGRPGHGAAPVCRAPGTR